jgi:CheY-like chemotaxis protein
MSEILVVEDDPDIRTGLAELLAVVTGHVVRTAANGLEALDRLRGGSAPCIILLDLMMPVMNGWDFRTEQLRDPSLAAIPVVVLSGAADVPHHAARLGAVAWATKPFKMDALLRAVEQHC